VDTPSRSRRAANSDVLHAFGSLAAIAAVTVAYTRWLHGNTTTVALSFLLIVLVAAATSRLWVAALASIVAMISLNFFFLPPVGTLTIVDPQNWVALLSFIAVSLVASNLSSRREPDGTRRCPGETKSRGCSISAETFCC